jgi:hypothetical protein
LAIFIGKFSGRLPTLLKEPRQEKSQSDIALRAAGGFCQHSPFKVHLCFQRTISFRTDLIYCSVCKDLFRWSHVNDLDNFAQRYAGSSLDSFTTIALLIKFSIPLFETPQVWRGCQRPVTTKKPKCGSISAFKKNWRQPTLAEAIQPLPSARLRLTAEFGMGSGRTTALWPPKVPAHSHCGLLAASGSALKEPTAQIIKEHHVFPENYTQEYRAFSVYRVEKSHFLRTRKKRSSLTTD